MPSLELPSEAQITEGHRRRAASLVRDGITVSLSLDIEPTPPRVPDRTDIFGPVQRFMLRTGEGLNDPDRVAPPRR